MFLFILPSSSLFLFSLSPTLLLMLLLCPQQMVDLMIYPVVVGQGTTVDADDGAQVQSPCVVGRAGHRGVVHSGHVWVHARDVVTRLHRTRTSKVLAEGSGFGDFSCSRVFFYCWFHVQQGIQFQSDHPFFTEVVTKSPARKRCRCCFHSQTVHSFRPYGKENSWEDNGTSACLGQRSIVCRKCRQTCAALSVLSCWLLCSPHLVMATKRNPEHM